MQMQEDRPISIGEMDFEFLTKGDPATDIQDAAGKMAENLTPEEQKEIAGLVPYVERFFILSHKAETGEFPPEPEFAADGGVSIDDYRSMSSEEQIANSMEGRQVNLGVARKSSFDKSPSGLPQSMNVESPEVQGPPAPQQEAEMQEGGVVEEEILVSNGEILIPDIIAQEIGYKRLEKINKRGEELTEKLIAEYEAGQQQQPQPQIKAPFEQAPKKTAFKEAKQSFS